MRIARSTGIGICRASITIGGVIIVMYCANNDKTYFYVKPEKVLAIFQAM